MKTIIVLVLGNPVNCKAKSSDSQKWLGSVVDREVVQTHRQK